jgi:hypothetical protein
MTDSSVRSVRRAERLLWAYPPTWRAQYGDEFVAVLLSEFEECPRSWRRTVDVVASGGVARLKCAGLAGRLAEPAERARKSLAVLWASAAIFLVFGAAMWSQVAVGWRWEPPSEQAVAMAMVVMSSAVIVLVTLAVLAAGPMMWALMRAAIRRQAAGLFWPSTLVVVGAALLIAGSAHFADRWPGTGGHAWGYHELAPSGIGAFLWAATRGVTSYWFHPGALATFPLGEVAWMAGSPVSIGCLVVGLTKTIRRLELSPRTWCYEAHLARAGAGVMLLFGFGAGCWVLTDATPGPTGIYGVGVIDVFGLAVLGMTWLVARRAAGQASDAGMALSVRPGR